MYCVGAFAPSRQETPARRGERRDLETAEAADSHNLRRGTAEALSSARHLTEGREEISRVAIEEEGGRKKEKENER